MQIGMHPDDLTDGDDTGQFVFACTDPVSNVRRSSQLRKIALERFDCTGVALPGLDEGHGSSIQPPEIPLCASLMVLRECDAFEFVWLTILDVSGGRSPSAAIPC